MFRFGLTMPILGGLVGGVMDQLPGHVWALDSHLQSLSDFLKIKFKGSIDSWDKNVDWTI